MIDVRMSIEYQLLFAWREKGHLALDGQEEQRMRIKKGFVLREVAGQTMVIATGEASKDFHGMIKLNATGRDIWNGLMDGLTEEEIAGKLVEKYEVDEAKALADTKTMIDRMKDAGFIVS